jgi:glycosyltransferase involved in cell wall biosynthesis
MAACLKTLREEHGVELLVFRTPPADTAPFDDRHFTWISELYDRSQYSSGEISEIVDQFSPDAVFMVGWAYEDYLRVARRLERHDIPVIAGSDAQWTSSIRQQLARVIAPWYLHSAIDVLWVAGERQRQLAYRLGYSGEKCWSGYYACNWEQFAAVYNPHKREDQSAFLFVGRYVPVKGLETLIQAYRIYSSEVVSPWQLRCVGTGEQRELLADEEGVIDLGFVQPDQLPDIMGRASGFVLPSHREPWGVVVQEAAASGLPLLCSDACGAAVHLLQDGYNGFLSETGNVRHLARCMKRMTEISPRERMLMGERSHELSKQYTPQRWADTLVRGIRSLS